MLRQYLKSLADKFREKLGVTNYEIINAQDFVLAIDEVYEAGKQAGGGGNTDEAFKNGKKEIWKGITCNNTRTVYNNAFQYTDLDYFYPYGKMEPTNAGYMFANTRNGEKINLKARLAECGGTLDFSNATNMQRAFYVSGVTDLGVIDCTATTNLAYLYCSSTYLQSIEKMIVHSGNTYQSSFDACSALTNIEFEGEIGNNISFANCTNLTRNSLMSIINHLQVKTSGEFTLTLSADSIEKLTVAEMDIASDKGWNIPNA